MCIPVLCEEDPLDCSLSIKVPPPNVDSFKFVLFVVTSVFSNIWFIPFAENDMFWFSLAAAVLK